MNLREHRRLVSRSMTALRSIAPQVVNAALIAALALDLAGLLRSEYRLRQPASREAVLAPTHHAAVADLKAVVNAHLFGEAPGAPEADAAQAAKQLVLTGTIASADPRRGFAILGDPAHGTQVFSVGSTLPNGARLEQVLADRVMIASNGASRTLLLPRGSRRGGALQIASAAADPPASTLNPRQFSHARSWFSGFMARPLTSNDAFKGYVLHPQSRYKRLYGVHDGDLVTAINGVPLDSPDAAADQLQQFNGPAVSLTVMRDGVLQDLKLDIK